MLTSSAGVWISLFTPKYPSNATPLGRHRDGGKSFALVAAHSLTVAAAPGSRVGSTGSTTLGAHHTPERSGLPSRVRGAGPFGVACGAERLAKKERSSPSVL